MLFSALNRILRDTNERENDNACLDVFVIVIHNIKFVFYTYFMRCQYLRNVQIFCLSYFQIFFPCLKCKINEMVF